MAPKDHMSVARKFMPCGSPRNSSGAWYSSVPITVLSPLAPFILLLIPKSASLTHQVWDPSDVGSSLIRMFFNWRLDRHPNTQLSRSSHLWLYVTMSKPFPVHHCQALQYLTGNMARVILR
jgi:hypothetical protein